MWDHPEREPVNVYAPCRVPEAHLGVAAVIDEVEGVLMVHLHALPVDGRIQLRVPQLVELRQKLMEAKAELAAARERLSMVVRPEDG